MMFCFKNWEVIKHNILELFPINRFETCMCVRVIIDQSIDGTCTFLSLKSNVSVLHKSRDIR